MPQKRLRIKNKKELLAIELFVNHVKKSLGDNISFIKLFGSKARGTADKDSDIDILIVTKDYSNADFDTP
ncbi:MAG: nucleotidyltransferase domain-containing protein [bacterium]